ncbi:MAG: hypothetical protein SR1Q5_03245 [Quinella sp. 1Q5]|nr:hypothetical protein [Quinella sp. 1Q5]
MTTEEKLNYLEQRVTETTANVNNLIAEAQQQREDLRRLNERMNAAQEKHDADVKDLLKQINATWRQTMIGVGGMIVVLGALLIAVLK